MARRRQIIDATIATVSELGYQRASFAAIASRAGLSSTRLVSYHFDHREDLMAQTASHVSRELSQAVESEVRAAPSPAAAVRGYIRANVAYMDSNRAQIGALTSLLSVGALPEAPGQRSAGVEALTAIIDHGRAVGEFRDVDPRAAATIVQRAVEGVPLLLREDPEVDLSGHAEELVRFFDAALAHSVTEGASR
jgi:AcrR family transcriptional regulator